MKRSTALNQIRQAEGFDGGTSVAYYLSQATLFPPLTSLAPVLARARVTINTDGEIIVGAGAWRESDARVWKEAKQLLDHRIIDRVSPVRAGDSSSLLRGRQFLKRFSKENDGMTRVRSGEQRKEVSLSGGDAANSHIICSLLIHWTQQ
ncbi:hypothetical protein K0M31_004936 [Melipona bicolor]|uniref:Uncharacterized protein n=1 Tax=Melipona bicolor TaxID=60889 RepID=A0AA40KN26_9HYME|nr:hypothetical protein K0M31_004936 [Melipona bicolor]